MFGDGLEGANLHFHAGAGSGFDGGHRALAADEGDVDAAGSHQSVTFLQTVAVSLFFLGFLALWTNEEQVEDGYHQHNHNAGFPAFGNVEKYEFGHFFFTFLFDA